MIAGCGERARRRFAGFGSAVRRCWRTCARCPTRARSWDGTGSVRSPTTCWRRARSSARRSGGCCERPARRARSWSSRGCAHQRAGWRASIREAVRYLDGRDREALLAAYWRREVWGAPAPERCREDADRDTAGVSVTSLLPSCVADGFGRNNRSESSRYGERRSARNMALTLSEWVRSASVPSHRSAGRSPGRTWSSSR